MKIKPFKAYRPVKSKVAAVASRPYDVLDSKEARQEAAGNPDSFLYVVKPEIGLDDEIDQYDPRVYQAGRENFEKLLERDVFFQDETASLYLYELVMNGRSQTGIVACASVDDYMSGRIRKHELTRPDKEADRKQHVRSTMMNAEPVFFAYRYNRTLGDLVAELKQQDAEYDFLADDSVNHRLWRVDDERIITQITGEFEKMPATYVADGHHRTAAAALVGAALEQDNPEHTGEEEYNFFLAVHFPDNELEIIDYNRVVRDLNGHEKEAFLQAIAASFSVKKLARENARPGQLHQISMYLQGQWYSLAANRDTYDDSDPIAALDVTILSQEILEPLLGIEDLRTDKRIEFVGGIRGLGELENKVDSGEMAVAFAMYPVSMQQLMNIADNDLIMPPKVTWFEPKLRSGLFVHALFD